MIVAMKVIVIMKLVTLHDYRSRSADETFQLFVHADGSVGMYQPNSFTRIVQKVDKGVKITELEQMIILRNTLNGIIQARQQIQRDMIQRSVQSDGPSVDSGSDGEEEK